MWAVAKDAQWKSENDFRQLRDLLKGQIDCPTKRVNLFFHRGCWRGKSWRWYRWWGESHHAITDLCDSNTEYWRTFCLSAVFIVLPSYQPVRCGGGGIDKFNTFKLSQLGFQLLARPAYNGQGFQLLCDRVRRIKPIFVITSNTEYNTPHTGKGHVFFLILTENTPKIGFI